jgi:carbon-monoxide dehydrogenase medium subunit
MYSANFEYFRPATLAEAISILSQNKDAKLLAGGHSLIPAMKMRLAQPVALVDIGRIKELSGINFANGQLTIGAMTTQGAIAASEVVKKNCPILAEASGQVGDTQVRNRGTLGGSLAHADPAADVPTVMVALDATLTATGPGGRRDIPASAFFTSLLTTALQADEVLTSITINTSGLGKGGAYLKHPHPASGYAVVGVAAVVGLDGGKCAGVRVAIGGSVANPVRVSAAESALNGQEPSEANIAAAAAKAAEVKASMNDWYASAEYRQSLATTLTKRALTKAAERAK